MELLVSLIVAALAAKMLLDIWFYSALFADMRARTQLWNGFFGQLVQCRFCMGGWVSAFTTTLVIAWHLAMTPVNTSPVYAVLGWLVMLPVLTLAVAKLASWLDDWAQLWKESRPNHLETIPDESESEWSNRHGYDQPEPLGSGREHSIAQPIAAIRQGGDGIAQKSSPASPGGTSGSAQCDNDP